MKKLNNKGFAITTVIYGLSIMGILLIAILMGVMSVTRSNNSKLAKSVEDDLERFSRAEISFGVDHPGVRNATASAYPQAQIFEVPDGESGWYRIELLGAGGGAYNSNNNTSLGGLGAYASGVIKLEEGDKLYFYIGKSTGLFGQSTDVRLVKGAYDNKRSYDTRIMVAAGGGKNDKANGGTLVGYSSKSVATGGKLNINIGGKNYSLRDKTLVGYPTNYSLSDAGIVNNYTLAQVNATQTPSPIPSGNGGSGYISSSNANYGGTSYISGYAGAVAATTNIAGNTGLFYKEQELDEETLEYIDTGAEGKIVYFVDGQMFAGVNTGDGSAKIERVVVEGAGALPKANNKLNSIKKITDCVEGPATDPKAYKIAAVSMGVDYALGKPLQNVAGTKCVTVTIDPPKDLDEIAVWHGAGKDYVNHTIKVTNQADVEFTLKDKATTDSETNISETETPVGYRVSAYQYDSVKSLPEKGNYYVIPVLTENMSITATENAQADSNPIKVNTITGLKRQKWSVELIKDSKISPGYVSNDSNTYEYKIVELARFHALTINLDENKERNNISAPTAFNSIARNDPQIWSIKATGNGTYIITSKMEIFDEGIKTGTIFPQMDATIDGGNDGNSLLIGRLNKTTERFRFVSIDYSNYAHK